VKIIRIIPVRYESTWFPRKPNSDIYGKFKIWCVYQQEVKIMNIEVLSPGFFGKEIIL